MTDLNSSTNRPSSRCTLLDSPKWPPLRMVAGSAGYESLLDGPAVTDISVVDPPLEQVIAEIYELPAR